MQAAIRAKQPKKLLDVNGLFFFLDALSSSFLLKINYCSRLSLTFFFNISLHVFVFSVSLASFITHPPSVLPPERL